MGEPAYVVFPFSTEELKKVLGNSDQAEYIIRYLDKLCALTCVLEHEYIDKDFILDYQIFYCRSFEKIPKSTERIHFFSKDFSDYHIEECLKENLQHAIQRLNEDYLGFIVLKPIKDVDGQRIIGRTILKPYPSENKRFFVTGNYSASLFGMNLEVRSLPFQTQDEGVSVCATVSLWSALHPLRDIFEIARHSPAEITEMSSTSPNKDRKFPSTGLNLEQMVNYIGRMGLDVETLNPKSFKYFTTFVKMYAGAGLPIIAALTMTKGGNPQRHAVVIGGYKIDTNYNIVELFVHDDRIGPYCRVRSDNGMFLFWKYDKGEWNDWGYEVKMDKLIAPIYPKIRTPFRFMNHIYMSTCDDLRFKKKLPAPEYHCELCLTTIRDYKKFLLESQVKNKLSILMGHLPKFIWIIRLYHKDNPISDSIFDSTSVYPRALESKVIFDYE